MDGTMTLLLHEQELGYYVQWKGRDGSVLESLRTKDKDRAESWIRQAKCHGYSHHHLSCPYCQK